ncbi:MAG: UbiX family flavin prenyltransferase [Desulfurococcales archaeon]|nr:UbiX family flavin prenyltransferase [Desulfurococcales archaeon]
MKLLLGVSGASGLIYGLRAAEILKDLGHETLCVVTDGALKVAEDECLGKEGFINSLTRLCSNLYREGEWEAPIASSSCILDGGLVIPCSLKTLAEIANGLQGNLLSRAVNNLLRMGRKVVLVVRETPLSLPDLENMVKASRAGATIMPASPAFYINPLGISDLVDFIVGKALDVLGVKNSLYRRWEGFTPGSRFCDRFYGSEGL